jgi:hypothetical protein
MPRSPSEKLVVYLLLSGYSTDDVIAIVKRRALDVLSVEYVEELRASCVPPTPFRPDDAQHIESQRFLLHHGVRALVFPDDDMRVANRMLDTPRARETVETLLLSRAPAAWIGSALRRDGFQATARAVDLFRHFYADFSLLESSEILPLLVRRASVGGPAATAESPRMLAARSAGSPLGLPMAMLRRGILPSNLELGRVASATRAAAVLGSFDAIVSERKPRRAQRMASVAESMTRVLEAVGDAGATLERQLAVRLEHDDTGLPDLSELSGGRHTVDLGALPEHDGPPAGAHPGGRP